MFFPFEWKKLDERVIRRPDWFIVTDYFLEWEADRIEDDVKDSVTWFMSNRTPDDSEALASSAPEQTTSETL